MARHVERDGAEIAASPDDAIGPERALFTVTVLPPKSEASP